jgi:putative aldouronate transport system substrate-binding protein
MPYSSGRRAFLGGIAGAAGLGLLSACGGAGTATKIASTCADKLSFDVVTPAHRPAQVLSSTPNTPVAWTRYPEPYVSWKGGPPGEGGTVTTFQILYGAPPPPLSQNPWWKEYNRRLGVTWQPTLVAQPDYALKLDTLSSGGSFPDLTYVNFTQSSNAGATQSSSFQKIVSEGAFNDLTEYLSGSGLKRFQNLSEFPEITWRGCSFDGRIFGVPYPIAPVNGSIGLYRKDWAEKLGVDNPKNASEVLKMFAAFAKGHPEGPGTRTWGLSASFSDLWNSMFRVPNNWRLNKDGSLTKDLETEEFRAAIDFSHQMWKAGAIYPDALSLSYTQGENLWLSGIVGFFAGGYQPLIGEMTAGPPPNLIDNIPHAKPYPLIPPGHDGGQPAIPSNAANFGFTGIPSTIKDEKRIVELIRIMDYIAAPFGSEEFNFIQYGIEGTMYNMTKGVPISVSNGNETWKDGLNYLNSPAELNYFYPLDSKLGPFAQEVQARIIQKSIADPTLGLYSPTWVSQNGTLTELVLDATNAIMVGRQPLSSLDSLISNWKQQGGDRSRREFEQALRKCSSG